MILKTISFLIYRFNDVLFLQNMLLNFYYCKDSANREKKKWNFFMSSSEMLFILCKDNARRVQNIKLACMLCRAAAYLMQS